LGILIYALLSGEYPLNAAKDHIQMNERVSKHNFELDRTRGNYSDEACDLVKKLLRKSPQKRLKSLNEMKMESFFRKEIDYFLNMYLKLNEKNKSMIENDENKSGESDQDILNNQNKINSFKSVDTLDEHEKRIIRDNFWNPYVIIHNYSPLELLFEEIYAIKHKQTNMNEKLRHSQLSNSERPLNGECDKNLHIHSLISNVQHSDLNEDKESFTKF
jgi:serine/threonine protein kinase